MPTITLQRYLFTWSCISLRTLIVTSVYNLFVFLTSFEVWDKPILLPLVILVHHGLSVFCLEYLTIEKYFLPLPAIIDWLLITGEISAWFSLRFFTLQVGPWDTSKLVVLFGSLYVQLAVLISLWFIRIISLIRQLFWRPCLPPDLSVDLLAPTNDLQTHKNFWKGRLQLIFGRSLWGPKFRRGNRRLFIVVRGILALAMLMGMLIFTTFSLIIWPVSETGMVPVKTLRSPGLRWGFQSLSPSWNIFVMLGRDVGPFTIDTLHDAIHVTPLWEDLNARPAGPCNPTDQKPPCQYKESDDAAPLLRTYNTPWSTKVYSLHYFCPNCCTRNLTFSEFCQVPVGNTLPDLLVTVNFTTLGISPLSSTVGGSQSKSVGVIVAFVKNIDEVLRVSPATSLLPGMHIIGRVGMEFRTLIENSKLAALGLASPEHTFIASSVYDLTQDPAPPSEENTTASLRLYVPYDGSDWNFIQEDREKSVLGGFAAMGGLWTGLNGIFSFFFGGTLALLLWGQKPFSLFGVLDKPWQESVRKEWEEERREALSKVVTPSLDDNEWIMLIRRKLVDVNPLEDG